MMTTEDIWNALDRDAAGQSLDGLAFRRIFPVSQRNLFLGISHPGKRRLLILQVELTQVPPAYLLTETQGLNVCLIPLPDDGQTHRSLVLTLKDDRDADIFGALVQDIAAAVAPTRSDHDAVSVFLGRLKKWQRVLDEKHGQGLGTEARRGLFGELWFLRENILPLQGSDGITTWTGCHHAPQDFQFPHGAIEIKTSISQSPQKVTISSARQLDDTGLEHLFLLHLSLLQQPEGETLPVMVETIRQNLPESSWQRETFEFSLLEAGYHDAHASTYSAEGYSLRTAHFFRVVAGFPRLRECDLVCGVDDVTYSVNIPACQKYLVSADLIKDFLQAL